MSSATPAYDGLSQRDVTTITSILVAGSLAIISVVLRLFSRHVSTSISAEGDDWAILVGLILLLALILTCTLWAAIGNVDRTPDQLPTTQSERWLKVGVFVVARLPI